MELFEVKVKYQSVDQNGKDKLITESYLLDAVSFTDAETVINNYTEITDSEFLVMAIKRSNINEVLTQFEGERLYKCKVTFITFNEETGREKKSAVYMLVPADNVDLAYFGIHDVLSKSVTDYVISGVVDSKLVEYIANNPE